MMLDTSEAYLGNSQVPLREEIAVLDSTKISGYMRSPRYFFFSHVLGWRGDQPNIHLFFGSLFHDAMEKIQLAGYTPQDTAKAAEEFIETFRTEYPDPDLWEIYAPKTPQAAAQALFEYANAYDFSNEEVLFTEIAGAVPISLEKGGRVIHFKMDTILNHLHKGFISREHKTTKYLNDWWATQWQTKFQVGTYSHVLFVLKDFLQEQFGMEPIAGVEINGFAFAPYAPRARKTSLQDKFKRVLVQRTDRQIEQYLITANRFVDDMEKDFEKLADDSPSNDQMHAFPCNGENCATKYGGCPFADFCEAWSNPLQHIEKPPIGFMEEHWDPRQLEEEATTLVDPSGKAIKKEQ